MAEFWANWLLWLPVALPVALGLLVFMLGGRVVLIRSLLVMVAVVDLGLAAAAWFESGGIWKAGSMELLGLDSVGGVFLLLVNGLFLLTALHVVGWLPKILRFKEWHGMHFQKERTLIGGLLIFSGMATLVMLSRNFGLLWVAVEATTMVTAPLICFSHSASSLEAMWKYLLLCSVGIGLALFGTMLAAHAIQLGTGDAEIGLNFTAFLKAASGNRVELGWFKAGFIFVLAGYGTKMELAPFHTWLPDTYSEAPSPVAALLSGMLASCAFLAVWRFFAVTPDALREFGQALLVALGLVSLATAAFFIARQGDYKRMLAYSSVEHMGLATIMLALGGVELAILHCIGHALIKTMLSLTAGNIQLGCGLRSIRDVDGLLERMPRNAVLWLTGLLLISGTPPSPLFVTEFALVRRAGPLLGGTILLLLFVIFAGMSQAMIKMCMGSGSRRPNPLAAATGEKLWPIPVLLALLALGIGIILTVRLDGAIKLVP